jgi:hypothetical protein
MGCIHIPLKEKRWKEVVEEEERKTRKERGRERKRKRKGKGKGREENPCLMRQGTRGP